MFVVQHLAPGCIADPAFANIGPGGVIPLMVDPGVGGAAAYIAFEQLGGVLLFIVLHIYRIVYVLPYARCLFPAVFAPSGIAVGRSRHRHKHKYHAQDQYHAQNSLSHFLFLQKNCF